MSAPKGELVLTSKAMLFIGGWLALTATLVGTSGIAGDAASSALLIGGAVVALVLSRGPRTQR
jgi:membrane associated rhomboid family serine protease